MSDTGFEGEERERLRAGRREVETEKVVQSRECVEKAMMPVNA